MMKVNMINKLWRFKQKKKNYGDKDNCRAATNIYTNDVM